MVRTPNPCLSLLCPADRYQDAGGIAVQLSTLLVALGVRIRKAIEQQKDLPKELTRCKDEVDATRTIVDLVNKESVLRDAEAVHTALECLHKLAEELDKKIQAMGKKRSTVRGVTHQFAHGTAEQQSLSKIIDLLVRNKQNLVVQIQLVQVGLTRETRDAVAINTILVQRIDRSVQRALGSGHSLAIAALVRAKMKDQRPNGACSHLPPPAECVVDQGANRESLADGMLKLTLAEFEAFQQEVVQRASKKTAAAGETGVKKRIVTNNLSTGDSLQLNAPIDEDLWKDMDVVKIDGCFASERSIQCNYIQNGTTFDKLLKAREESLSLQQRR